MEPVIAFPRDEITPLASGGESAVEQFIGSELTKPRRGRLHSAPSHAAGPLPLIIGVTGHRDVRPDDIPHIEQAVRDELSRLRELYPATPFVLLSALADGADRLAARVALESGMRLIVVLPMPMGLYETDFDAASKEEFHALRARAEHSFELPILNGLCADDIIEHGPAREQQYAQVGAYLATHSTILFALWDGVPLRKIGGTSQVVRFKLEGVPVPYARPHSELDAPDTGPVYHLVMPRESNPNPVGHAYTVRQLYPDAYDTREEAEQAYDDIYDRMEMLNTDAIRYTQELRQHVVQSEEYLFPNIAESIVGDADVAHPLPTPLHTIRAFYAIADVLSQRFQKRTFGVLRVLLSFVFLAAVFLELYSGLLPETSMIALYLGMFICAYASYKWADKHAYQTRYLDYRALAEGLRIQFFWKLAGIEESVADYYLRKQKSELEWIRNAIRSSMAETNTGESPARNALNRERLNLVLKHWVEDQAQYFSRAARRDHDRMHRQERWMTLLFTAALVIAVVQVVIGDPMNELILPIAVLPVAAALIGHFIEKNALAEHKQQYTRMSLFYHRAKVHLKRLIEEGRFSDAQAFIAELGREALAENGDWILTHRDRPLEVPKGG
ncbi:MAG TPA: hypothetical protein VFD13_02125 [Candidatus Kapabacteria bacterium]|nr:hypothetical protein [Candidatus Kapabacteria bacterium]